MFNLYDTIFNQKQFFLMRFALLLTRQQRFGGLKTQTFLKMGFTVHVFKKTIPLLSLCKL